MIYSRIHFETAILLFLDRVSCLTKSAIVVVVVYGLLKYLKHLDILFAITPVHVLTSPLSELTVILHHKK